MQCPLRDRSSWIARSKQATREHDDETRLSGSPCFQSAKTDVVRRAAGRGAVATSTSRPALTKRCPGRRSLPLRSVTPTPRARFAKGRIGGDRPAAARLQIGVRVVLPGGLHHLPGLRQRRGRVLGGGAGWRLRP